MRKITALLLAAVLFLSAAVPVQAGSEFAQERYQNTVSFCTGGGVIKSTGALWVWGQIGEETVPGPKIALDGAVSVSKGYNHCAVVKSDGSLWTWGRNNSGQLGTGTVSADPVMTPTKVMDGVQAVSCGEGCTLILKQDRTLWGCGRGSLLGTGDRENYPAPVKLMENVVAVQANSDCVGVLKRDGSLWAWGSLAFTAQWSFTEKPRKLMDGVESFSICGGGVLAVKPDGSVWHLGLVKGGVKGGSSAGTFHTEPAKVMDGASSVSIAYGAFAVVKIDGTLWVWGTNDSGRLAAGETTYQEKPLQVLDNVAAAILSDGAMFVLKNDGNLWAIGNGYFGASGYASTRSFEKIVEGVRLPGVAPAQDIPGVTDRVSYIFKDVNAGAWYEKYLQTAYDNGIVGGTSDDMYTPSGQLNHGQIMVMAANLHSKQKGDGYDFQANKKAGAAWYQAFEDYCKAEGIIDDRFDGLETQNVSRDQMAYYFAHTLEVRYYTDKKEASFNDVSGNPYEEDILTLAKADIVGGKGDGIYDPAALVTRAEASVFVSNILKAIGE